MIILGIDPGTALTGYGIIKTKKDKQAKPDVIDFGCIATDKWLRDGERLKKIYKDLNKIIEKYNPDVISVETLYFFKNLKTVMPVSQARGIVLLAAAQKNIPVMEFTPFQVKITVVGYGRAEKKQVQEMTKKLVNISEFDFKKNNRKKDDATDALGVALCALYKKF